jgi:hypothetical protein
MYNISDLSETILACKSCENENFQPKVLANKHTKVTMFLPAMAVGVANLLQWSAQRAQRTQSVGKYDAL